MATLGSEPQPRALSKRRRAAFLSVPYVAFIAILLGVEGGVRLTLPHIPSLELFVTAPEQQAQFVDSQKVRIFEGDPLLFWRLQPNLHDALWELTRVSTNPQGIRYPRAVDSKTPGTFRVVCLGDSVTFGFRLPRVFAHRPEDHNPDWLPYPALIERRLRAANPGRKLEVIPLAVPGYSSHQGLAWLRRDIEALRPDVVTACFGWNDIGLRQKTDRIAMRTDGVSVATRRLVAASQTLSYVWRGAQSLRGAGRERAKGASSVMRVPADAYVSNMIEISRLSQRHGASVAVIAPIYRDRVSYPSEAERLGGHRKALRDAVMKEGIAYLEIRELTEAGHPGNAPLFDEHIHPSHKGHRVLASALLDFLAAQGMLGDVAAPPMESLTK